LKEAERKSSEAQASLEEKHPLLKRALEQPPQIYRMKSSVFFQEEVGLSRKRFCSGIDSSNCKSILASQLAEPPMYQPERAQKFQTSLLASSLNRATTQILSEESKRNEILARLILEGNPLKRFSPSAGPANFEGGQNSESTTNTWRKHHSKPSAMGSECLSKRPDSPMDDSTSTNKAKNVEASSPTDSHPLNLSTRPLSQPKPKDQSSNLDIQLKA